MTIQDLYEFSKLIQSIIEENVELKEHVSCLKKQLDDIHQVVADKVQEDIGGINKLLLEANKEE